MGQLRAMKLRNFFNKFLSFPFSVATYLHVFPELLQEHLLVLAVDVDLLAVVDEVVVLVGGQLLGLPVSRAD